MFRLVSDVISFSECCTLRLILLTLRSRCSCLVYFPSYHLWPSPLASYVQSVFLKCVHILTVVKYCVGSKLCKVLLQSTNTASRSTCKDLSWSCSTPHRHLSHPFRDDNSNTEAKGVKIYQKSNLWDPIRMNPKPGGFLAIQMPKTWSRD